MASEQTTEASFSDEKEFRHCFRYLNGVPRNDANFDLEVNFLEYWEEDPHGRVQHFSWVSDIPIDHTHLMTLMRGARARWKIENETFNTLKNHGYHFEHNFGHGNQYLSTVLMHLMMLAFLIDYIQQRCCRLFQAALTASKGKTRLWRKLRNRCYWPSKLTHLRPTILTCPRVGVRAARPLESRHIRLPRTPILAGCAMLSYHFGAGYFTDSATARLGRGVDSNEALAFLCVDPLHAVGPKLGRSCIPGSIRRGRAGFWIEPT